MRVPNRHQVVSARSAGSAVAEVRALTQPRSCRERTQVDDLLSRNLNVLSP